MSAVVSGWVTPFSSVIATTFFANGESTAMPM